MSHTPAPWTTHNNIGKKGELGVIADEAPCIIAIMGNQDAWRAEAEANARLIAAAPELLEALTGLMKEAVKLAETQPDNAPIWAWIDDASDAINKATRAAIQKAEG